MFIFDNDSLTGIDIGSYALKVVKLKGKGSNRSLAAAGYSQLSRITLPQGDSKLSETIRNLFHAHRIKTKKVAAIFSGGSLAVAHLYIPDMPKKDMKEAVRWEMRKHVTFSPEELVYDFTTIGEVKRGDESMLSLIAFGAPKKHVEQLIKTLEDAMLEPVMIDVAPIAMLACFDYNNMWENGVNYSMIDIGDAKSTLAVFKNKKLMFVREISIAGREMTSAVMNKLSCSEDVAEKEKIRYGIVKSGESASGVGQGVVDAVTGVVERLAAEVHRSFDYYQAQFREESISKIFLCGGSSRLKGIDNFFAHTLGIPCFIDDPLRNIKIGSRRFNVSMIKEFASDLAIAVGLAL